MNNNIHNWEYENTEQGLIITKYIGSDIDVIIPDIIENIPVIGISGKIIFAQDSQIPLIEPVFSIGIKSVKIPEGIVYIGDVAFNNLKLSSINLPSTLLTIGIGAFKDNDLTEIIIPNKVKKISDQAFALNKIESIYIPESVYTIGRNAFMLNKISDLFLADGLKEIHDGAFSYNKLTKVIIPSSVEYIGNYAFNDEEIKEIIIGSNVEFGDESVFSGYKKFDAFYHINNKKGGSYHLVNTNIINNEWKYTSLDKFENHLDKIEKKDIILDIMEVIKNIKFKLSYKKRLLKFAKDYGINGINNIPFHAIEYYFIKKFGKDKLKQAVHDYTKPLEGEHEYLLTNTQWLIKENSTNYRGNCKIIFRKEGKVMWLLPNGKVDRKASIDSSWRRKETYISILYKKNKIIIIYTCILERDKSIGDIMLENAMSQPIGEFEMIKL
jgi:hypothetical protein